MLRWKVRAIARHALAFAIVAAAAGPHMANAQSAATARREMPNFLDQGRLAHLEEARAALQAIAAREAATTSFTGRDEAEKIMTNAGDVQRRAEAERALAAEVRARAEALSQRFSAEIAEASREKPAAAAAEQKSAAAPKTVTTASVEPRAALAMQRAAEALTRARRDLEEATRRASQPDQQRNSAGWQKAKAEIDEARRRASEAVEQAQKAIDEQKELAAPTVASAEPAPAANGGDKPREPRMVPPFALGGMTR